MSASTNIDRAPKRIRASRTRSGARYQAGGAFRKYRLTILFLFISTITIGTAAIAVNHLSAKSAEANLVALTKAQSSRDAGLIADLVGQLLGGSPTSGGVIDGEFLGTAPGGQSAAPSLGVDYPTLLESLAIAEINVFDLSGGVVWTSVADDTFVPTVQTGLFARAVAGEIASGLSRGKVVYDADAGRIEADIVETYIPLLNPLSGSPVGVLGVSRDVTDGLASQIAEARNTVLSTTLISLSGVFLILLLFVLLADIRIRRTNTAAVGRERDISFRLGEENEELQQINQAKSEFISTISHELMTPLTSTIAFTDLVLRNRDSNLSGRQIEHLTISHRNSQQLKRLIGDLLDMSRIDKDMFDITYQRFEAGAHLQEVVQAMTPMLEAKGQRLETHFENTSREVEADRDRLTQVIGNLLSNASKYSEQDSEIVRRASVRSNRMEVSVEDHGIGISEEDQQQLFTMFFRADNEATRSVSGTGIGLMTAKAIIEQHGGRISVESQLGVGTKISFFIPQLASAATDDGVSQRRLAEGTRFTDGSADRLAS